MTRYRLYKLRDDIKPGWRVYLCPVIDTHGNRHSGIVELNDHIGAIKFTPAVAVIEMHKDKNLRKEEIKNPPSNS